MATVTLGVASNGALQQWGNGAGTPPTSVQTNDGNTSYRNTSTVNKSDLFVMDTLVDAAAVATVTTRTWAVGVANACTIRHLLYHNDTTQLESANHTHEITTYNEETEAWATNAKAETWTMANVNDSQFGYHSQGLSTSCRVTMFNMDVDYTPTAGGGYYWLIGSVLAPLINAGYHGLSVADIASFFKGFRIRPSGDEEFASILAENSRRPVYGFASR